MGGAQEGEKIRLAWIDWSAPAFKGSLRHLDLHYLVVVMCLQKEAGHPVLRAGMPGLEILEVESRRTGDVPPTLQRQGIGGDGLDGFPYGCGCQDARTIGGTGFG